VYRVDFVFFFTRLGGANDVVGLFIGLSMHRQHLCRDKSITLCLVVLVQYFVIFLEWFHFLRIWSLWVLMAMTREEKATQRKDEAVSGREVHAP